MVFDILQFWFQSFQNIVCVHFKAKVRKKRIKNIYCVETKKKNSIVSLHIVNILTQFHFGIKIRKCLISLNIYHTYKTELLGKSQLQLQFFNSHYKHRHETKTTKNRMDSVANPFIILDNMIEKIRTYCQYFRVSIFCSISRPITKWHKVRLKLTRKSKQIFIFELLPA